MASKTDAVEQLDSTWTVAHEEYGQTVRFNNVGDVFIGTYVSKSEVEFTDERSGETRMVDVYRFTNDKDDRFTVWGSANISKGMEKVPVGHKVRIEYKGNVEIGKGQTVNEFRIAYKPA